jgi:hypothetical protein
MSSQRVMSSEEANNNPGLCPIKGHSRPLFASDLSPCIVGDLPILAAGDSNAKHVDWNSGLIRRGRLVRDYTPKFHMYRPNDVQLCLTNPQHHWCNHHYHKRCRYSRVSDHMLHTELGALNYTKWHEMLTILPQPIRPYGFKKEWRPNSRPAWNLDSHPTLTS